jgi:hypothetical protein
LIGANLLVFGAYSLNLMSKRFFVDNFAFSTYHLKTLRLHTMLTHSLAHMNFMHLCKFSIDKIEKKMNLNWYKNNSKWIFEIIKKKKKISKK